MEGSVKWFNDNRGYGFIHNDTDEDIFVHYSVIKSNGFKTLAEGQNVKFDLVKTGKGFQAKNVESV